MLVRAYIHIWPAVANGQVWPEATIVATLGPRVATQGLPGRRQAAGTGLAGWHAGCYPCVAAQCRAVEEGQLHMNKATWQQIQRIGSACWKLGLTRSDNPYAAETQQANAWLVGWNVEQLGWYAR